MVEENNKVPSAGPAKAALEGMVAFDYPFVKVPLEQTRKVFRNSQRILEKDLGPLTKLESLKKVADLSTTLNHLKDLRSKLVNENQVESLLYRQRCAKRLKHLDQVFTQPSGIKQWEDMRVDRFIDEYLLTKGLFETSELFTSNNHLADMEFSDREFFRQQSQINERLLQGSTTECLLWCQENKAHLKKTGSPLEFYLRRQTFVELARRRELLHAITYAKKFFPPFAEFFSREIEQTMALLAVGPNTRIQLYRSLYDQGQWKVISKLFQKEILDLHAIPPRPQLLTALQAGLAALKTPKCGEPQDMKHNCPVCCPPFSRLATGLPFSHHENSTLVCRISGEVMNDTNPPMVLPNGRVYSQKSLDAMAKQNNGKLQCPITGDTFAASQVKKIFIL